jgi:hypothetical protein
MHPGITIVYEGKRGCGYRDKPGRLYVRLDGEGRGCGKMPIPFEVCPCCGEGIRYSRAPRWIEEPHKLWDDLICGAGDKKTCRGCPLKDGYHMPPALLIWIGEKYYPTAADFKKEAEVMGISRAIKSIPRDFVVGQTWVLLAHKKAIQLTNIFDDDRPERYWQEGIFRVFQPDRIEVIVSGEEPDEVIDDYLKRGLTPVLVKRIEAKYKTEVVDEDPPEQQALF